jgi:hypothetical protein
LAAYLIGCGMLEGHGGKSAENGEAVNFEMRSELFEEG